MIQAVARRGPNPTATAICDTCGQEQDVVCDYERHAAGKWLPNEGQILTKVQKAGWTIIKNVLRCPTCEAQRAVNKEPVVTVITEIRKPTREQKRQIVDLLGEVYDIKAERYIGGETDVTVAATVGLNCMSGWVAEIREEMFGPAGGNEDIEKLSSEVAGLAKTLTEQKKSADMIVRDLGAQHEKLAELRKRLEVVERAVGPKVRGA